MAVYLNFLLILTGLKGIHGVSTISEVSVKARDSISIPCFYGSQHRNHVKYLCNGYYWSSCSKAVTTNQPSSGKFSISDDKNQRIFTVTIKDLTDQDTDYWCAVEINEGPDVRGDFRLSVTTDTPSLYVDNQHIEAFEGVDTSINCYHSDSREMKWCRMGRSCVTKSSGLIDGTRVTIDSKPNVFTVTMSGLKTGSSGWYMCAKGDLQMPVYVTVKAKPTTTTVATITHLTTLMPTHLNLITGFADKENYKVQNEQHSSSSILTSFICRLSLLVLFVMMTSLILLKVTDTRRSKNHQPQQWSQAESDVEEI